MWLVACAPPEPEAPPTPYDPADYGVGEVVAPTPSLTAEEVGDAVATWLPYLALLPVDAWLAAYLRGVESAEPGCPVYWDPHESDRGWEVYWYDDDATCPSGAWFNGYGEFYSYAPESASAWGGWQAAYVVGGLVTPAGEAVSANTYVYWGSQGEDDWWEWSAYLGGPVGWEGGEVGGTWLDEGYEAFVSSYVWANGDGAYFAMSPSGLANLPGPISAIYVEDLVLYSRSFGSPCQAEPAGAVSVRDAQGVWYRLAFDAPSDDAPDRPREACDGCAPVEVRGGVNGGVLGTACVDYGAVLEAAWYR